jgi:Spy/CpxP family protein refolding chaperone
MKRTTTLAALLILMFTATLALAQPPRGERPWQGKRDPGKMTEAFRLYKMTEYLELSEEQTAKIYPRIAANKKQSEEHFEQMKEQMKKLRELVDEEKWGKAAKLSEEIHALRIEHMDARNAEHLEMMSLLSDEQQAKFMLFEHRFKRHLKKMGEQMRGPGGPDGSGGPGGPGRHGGRGGQGPGGNRGPGGW